MDIEKIKSLLKKMIGGSASPEEEILVCKELTLKAKELNMLLENLITEVKRAKLSNQTGGN